MKFTGIGAGNQKGKVEQALGNINLRHFRVCQELFSLIPKEKGIYLPDAISKLELYDYVNWFNKYRIHGSLEYMTPAQYRQVALKKSCLI
ncbi:IS3 family transposase [Paenibacillus sp. JNUCC31]|uniref:IS3 family transposase n=1 Tax=Paenibacillus sp. JNUCC-31 TaxID=2777983 RepID=UPI00177B2132|nr:IS3 family transposase [Paenibacillus sp. JNUCC-31]